MAKKNYKKYLPKAGSTIAVAVAMTVALSTQAYATELDETDLLSGGDPVEGQESDKNLNPTEMEPAEYNEAVDQENKEILEDNEEAIESNEDTLQNNEDAGEQNEIDSEGELVKPELDQPEAPVAPDTEGEEVEDYNEAVGEYNEQVNDYNAAVDEYNQQVDDYNGAADDYDQKQQEQYEEEKAAHEAAQDKYEADLEQQEEDDAAYAQYQKDKEAYEQADAAYQEALSKYEESLGENKADSEAREQYLTEKAAYDQAHADYLAALEKYNDSLSQHDPGSEEYQQYLTEKAAYDQACADYLAALEKYNNETLPAFEAGTEAYQQYLDNKAAYDQAYADYLEALYQYNEDTLPGYQKKEEQSKKEQEILNDVNKYNDEVAEKNEQIEKDNAALEDDVDVGVVDSLDDVGALNENVTDDEAILGVLGSLEELLNEQDTLEKAGAALANHSGKGAELGSEEYAEYLKDVADHNAAVDTFNAKVAAYNEAVAAYNELVNQYNASQTGSSSSSTDEAETTGTADWGNFKDKNMSFNHLDVRYDAADVKDKMVDDEGNVIGYSTTVSKYDVVGVYYDEEAAKTDDTAYGITYTNTKGEEVEYKMTKDDEHNEFCTASKNKYTGEIDRTDASANKKTVVSFYATLDDGSEELKDIFVTLDANSVYADNSYIKYDSKDHLDQYKDSDGNGLTRVKIGDEWYYDVSGKPVFLISALACDGYAYNLGGLDLILNVQTMIEIHQADSAQKIGYMTYELEKYAATDDQTISDPGKKPVAPEFDQFNMDELESVNDPGERPDAPTYNPGDFTEPEPEELERMDHLEKLEKLNEKVTVQIEEPVDPPVTPDPVPDQPDPMPLADDGIVDIEIPDEEVPLAAAPKTGDISSLWGILSGFSAAGMFLLGKKRKDEE